MFQTIYNEISHNGIVYVFDNKKCNADHLLGKTIKIILPNNVIFNCDYHPNTIIKILTENFDSIDLDDKKISCIKAELRTSF